jgi:hypothetical protein
MPGIYQTIIDGVDSASVPDGYADEANPTTAYGAAKNIKVGVRLVVATMREYRALFIFSPNSEGVPFGALINSASLRVNIITAAAGARTAYLRRITPLAPPAIVETQFTWNKRNVLANWTVAGFDYTSSGQVNFDLPTATGIATSSELKGLIQYALDNRQGAIGLAWMLASNGIPGREIECDSRGTGTSGNRPALILYWTPPMYSHYRRLRRRAA